MSDDIFDLVAAERLRLADLLETLTDQQWSTDSLCEGWTVGAVAGHLTAPFSISVPKFILGSITSGGFHRYNMKAGRRLGQRPPAQIVAALRENAHSRFTPPGAGPTAPLTDVAVHTRDIGRPLGSDVMAPLPTWRTVLDFLVGKPAQRGFVSRSVVEGLHFTVTDQDWSHGAGPEVAGRSEAVAMALVGRTAALADLTGDGVAVLRRRLTTRV